ncbi:MAG TPA: hypothetical protein PLE30_11315 [Candidatus Kapabacteria bacterium]|nr:hypothetical protein [Candidatus Kapabacteria bacterium]
MKTISIANITEIKAVYLVCCKCGTKTSISVYTRDKRLRECVECQEPFDSAVIGSAIDFAGFKMSFLWKSLMENDLISFGNTVGITLDKISSGDILVERRNGKTGNHVQLVEYSNSTSIYIFQGNSGYLNWIPASSRVLGAGNPSSIFYTGQQIQTGHIYKSTGTYVNFITKQFYSEYTKSFSVVGAKWNFQNWKK